MVKQVVSEHEYYPWIANLLRRKLIEPALFISLIWSTDELKGQPPHQGAMKY